MICLENVTKYYRVRRRGETFKKYVFRNVSFTIPDGVNVGLVGRNGAGKSTLLRILGGLDHPSGGRVVSSNSFSWPIGLAGGMQGSLTGRENALFVLRIHSKTPEELDKALEYIQDFTELGEYFDMPTKTYSSGMKARLRFAMSLVFDFDYYLVDETLSVGDMRFKAKAQRALKGLTEKRNFLMVSHSLPLLRNMCDAGILLLDGTVTYYDNINEAVKLYNQAMKK